MADSGKPNREQRAARRDRWQHCVHPDSVVQPNIDAGAGLVDVPPTAGDQPDGEVADALLIELRQGTPLQPAIAIDPHFAPAVHENVSDGGVADERRQFAELEERFPRRSTPYPRIGLCTPIVGLLRGRMGDETIQTRCWWQLLLPV